MRIYAARYNSMVFESAYDVLSLHWSLAEAYRAMRRHRVNKCVEWRECKLMYGFYVGDSYDDFQDWDIKVFEFDRNGKEVKE